MSFKIPNWKKFEIEWLNKYFDELARQNPKRKYEIASMMLGEEIKKWWKDNPSCHSIQPQPWIRTPAAIEYFISKYGGITAVVTQLEKSMMSTSADWFWQINRG